MAEVKPKGGAEGWQPLEEAERSSRREDVEPPWPPFIIKETDPFKERWDLVILLCILYSALVVPFRLAFRAEAESVV